jgi:hypothetical protein
MSYYEPDQDIPPNGDDLKAFVLVVLVAIVAVACFRFLNDL